MKLSVIIVNYNVKYFLEQCLNSVRRASEGMEVETWVVDNSSVDGSVKMMREKFPEVLLIENKENVGFSRANNQAIRQSQGEYVLLLNPDTIVEDDTFRKVIAFMDAHPDAGGLGVKMIDGKGNFLPESKRGLPTPVVAFYKIFGLSKIFPKSRIFGRYHLGFLDRDQIHEVDILSGAFMLMRKSVLDKTGLLDETFFMYGEDIDLSYRINLAGYKNYYYPETRIIHYKGESTKKGSINYVFVFYNAMIIFARKHFSQKNARLFSMLINVAIYFRATLAIVSRFFSRAFLPLMDFILLYIGIFIIKNYWEQHVIFKEGGSYPGGFIIVVVPVYILIWLVSTYLSGGYDLPLKFRKIFQGITIGTLFILVVYALLPEKYRFSRAIILLGASWGAVSMSSFRLLVHMLKIRNLQIGTTKTCRFVIVGDMPEARRVEDLLKKSAVNAGFTGLVSVTPEVPKNDGFLGSLDQIKEIIRIHQIDEVIFCSKSLPPQAIMDQMSSLQDMGVNYKIAPEDSLSIIGSNSINTSGDLYTVDINAISKLPNRRNKRFFDITASLIMFILSPVLVFFVQKPLGLFRNIFLVISARRTWIGYIDDINKEADKLPHIRTGILNPADAFSKNEVGRDARTRLNYAYARDYNLLGDLVILLRAYRHIGRKT